MNIYSLLSELNLKYYTANEFKKRFPIRNIMSKSKNAILFRVYDERMNVFSLKSVRIHSNTDISKTLKYSTIEYRILSSLENVKNVSRVWEIFVIFEDFVRSKDYVCTVCTLFEYYSAPNLSASLESSIVRICDKKCLYNIFKTGFEILTDLARNSVVHRDIRPSNVIFDNSECKMILVDFDVSCYPELSYRINRVQDSFLKCTVCCENSPQFVAPEIYAKRIKWSQSTIDNLYKVDVYSLGCSLFCLFNRGNLPYGCNISDSLKIIKECRNQEYLPDYNNIASGLSRYKPGKFYRFLDNIMDICVNVDPETRPTAERILEMITLYGKKKNE